MDAKIKDIILDYIETNYTMSYERMVQYKVYCKNRETDVRLTQVYEDIMEIFGLDHKSTGEYFDAWINQEAIRIDNEAVYSEGFTGQMDMTDRVSVWGSLGKIARLRAIHDINTTGIDSSEPDEYEER